MSNDGDLNNMWNEATQGIASIDPGKLLVPLAICGEQVAVLTTALRLSIVPVPVASLLPHPCLT